MKHQKWWNRPSSFGFLNYGHKGTSSSEYIETYKYRPVLPRESCKPNVPTLTSSTHMSNKTTFRTEFYIEK
ncbi:unnamed protein product [Clavelina lepadiformis]|uniref:Uncharacterized protein n=1 Tax=Clavelina lepadiformis TaxID=159417 RepID=A0ABP0FFI0_CLALP